MASSSSCIYSDYSPYPLPLFSVSTNLSSIIRMEDPNPEWEIQDYSCYLENEETEKQSSGKLGWILKTGFNLGKKFVITGVVISSAPIVLPPLIVVSALGFACSVPFGFVFASYACTQKLMSKLLLPPPPPPPQYQMIDDYITYSSNEFDEGEAKDEEEFRDEIENAGLIENREKEDLGDDNKVGNEYEELTVVGESVLGKDNEEDGLNKQELENQSFKVVGEEIEVGGDVMAKDDSVLAAQNKEDDGKIKSEEIGDVNETEPLLKSEEIGDVNETEPLLKSEDIGDVNETEPLLKSEDIGDVNQTEPLLVAQNLDLNKGKSNVNNSNNENVEKLVIPEKKGKGKEKKRQSNLKGKSSTTTTSMGIDKKGNNKNKKRQEGDKRVHEKESKSSIESNSKSSQVKKAKLEVGEVHVPEASVISTEKSQSSKLEESVLPSGKNEAGNLDRSYEPIEKNEKSVDVLAIETTKEYHSEEVTVIEDTKYSLEVTDLTDLPELEHHEEKPELKVDVKNVRSDEELFSDEKIWKQIDAIRVIIGFNAPRNTSYFEELKALYLFTGIEPPSLLMGPSDLPDFYSKLRFLMSVIGVK